MNKNEDTENSLSHSTSSDSLDFGFEVIQSNLLTSNENQTLPKPDEESVRQEESLYSSFHACSDKVIQTIAPEQNSLIDFTFNKNAESHDACVQSGTSSESVCTPVISLLKFSDSDLSFIQTIEQCEDKNKVNEQKYNQLKTEFDKMSETCESIYQSNLSLAKEVEAISQKLSVIPDFGKTGSVPLLRECSVIGRKEEINNETPVFQDSLSVVDFGSNREIPIISQIQQHCDELERIMKQNKEKYECDLRMMHEKEEKYLEMLKSQDMEITALRAQVKEQHYVMDCAVLEARRDERAHYQREMQSTLEARVKETELKELQELKEMREMLLGDIQQKDMYILDLLAAVDAVQS